MDRWKRAGKAENSNLEWLKCCSPCLAFSFLRLVSFRLRFSFIEFAAWQQWQQFLLHTFRSHSLVHHPVNHPRNHPFQEIPGQRIIITMWPTAGNRLAQANNIINYARRQIDSCELLKYHWCACHFQRTLQWIANGLRSKSVKVQGTFDFCIYSGM